MIKPVSNILREIKEFNDALYNTYSPTEKIDFTKFKKNWGSDVIPKKFHIDVTKDYVTQFGLKVTDLHIVMENSCGNEVTYPVKGTIHMPTPSGKTKREYNIWTLDGRQSVNEPDNKYNLKAL